MAWGCSSVGERSGLPEEPGVPPDLIEALRSINIYNMFYVYVLQSEKNGRYYIGHTNSLERRLKQHNAGLVPSTRYLRPLTLVYAEQYEEGTQARQRERWLKAQKSRRMLEGLIKQVGL